MILTEINRAEEIRLGRKVKNIKKTSRNKEMVNRISVNQISLIKNLDHGTTQSQRIVPILIQKELNLPIINHPKPRRFHLKPNNRLHRPQVNQQIRIKLQQNQIQHKHKERLQQRLRFHRKSLKQRWKLSNSMGISF